MKKQNKTWHLIIENVCDSQIIELKRNNNFKDSYIRINKSEFKKLPKTLYKKLVNNGLYKGGEYIGFNENNSESSIHRLVSSIYYPCENLEIHHISNCTNQNEIANLLPIHTNWNKQFEKMPFEKTYSISKQKQMKLIKKYHKSKSTIFQNLLYLQDVMEKLKTKSIKSLIKKDKRLKKSSMYKLKKLYYYWVLFQNFSEQAFSNLYGKYKTAWMHIEEFDELKSSA